ncbi:MAG: hypothetical protein JXA95_01850 [Spirochaetales bacterium]|nr:hypothetical protein [Spirochaetales bacterium]
MRKHRILLVLLTVLFSRGFAQEVAEDEFLNAEPIEFINYTGPYDVINTLDQIRGIGEVLGQDVDPAVPLTAAYGPYRIIHSYQPEIADGLDGDILLMGASSQVDSVTNLRHIIGGYLESAYGYDRDKAFTLAVFITYYNAYWYQKIEHFSSRYKEGVTRNLEPDRCGLARVWSDWPGKARIVIPLRGSGSAVTGVDTAAISQEEVVNVMKEEEDKRIEERKDMVEIRDDENRQEEAALKVEQDNLDQKESAFVEEKKALEEKQEPLTPQEEKKLEELKKEEEAIQEEKAVLEEKQQELDKKTEEVLDMRDDIAVDENKRISEGDPQVEKKESVFVSPAEEGRVPLFFFSQTGIEEGYSYGTISLYDLTSGSKEKEATVTTIYGRTSKEYAGGFLAIGRDRKTDQVVPMIIDKENLAIILKGESEIFPGTMVTVDKSNQIYMVYKEGSGWRLGRFDKGLKLIGSSSGTVEPMTDILFYNGKIFVQSPEGKILVLNSDTLIAEKELK